MIVSILTDPAVGGTFLTWSLHYLAGDTEYFSIKNNKIIQLPDNPLTGINAHNFKPNQPLNGKQVLEYITALKNQNTNSLNTIYFHNFLDKETPQESLVSLTQEASDKTIVISHTSNNDLLYFCRYASRAGAFSYTDPFLFLIDPDEQFNDFINHFFRESKDKFYSSSTSEIWNYREFLALSLNYMNHKQNMRSLVDLTKSHYFINFNELFNRFEFTAKNLFNFLNLTIDDRRWDDWVKVYQNWKIIHSDQLQFMLYFDQIVQAIVNNYYIDLTRFNLDIVQEAALQRELLYKHNLTLKIVGLKKFIDTQQLHNLLEENIYHKI